MQLELALGKQIQGLFRTFLVLVLGRPSQPWTTDTTNMSSNMRTYCNRDNRYLHLRVAVVAGFLEACRYRKSFALE